jgi:hypothetical protein
MTESTLQAWLQERIDAGDIRYIEHRNGIAHYEMLRPVSIDETE